MRFGKGLSEVWIGMDWIGLDRLEVRFGLDWIENSFVLLTYSFFHCLSFRSSIVGLEALVVFH